MQHIKVLIIRSAGTNCDLETQYAWSLAGADADRVHIRQLIETPAMLSEYQAITIPGGFSYGDHIGAGVIFATQIARHLRDAILKFVERGGLVLGICNGFQILVKTGLLPGWPDAQRDATVTFNRPSGFQDRWVRLEAQTDECAFLHRGEQYEMPIAHGEGRVVFRDDDVRRRVEHEGLRALSYVPARTDGRDVDDADANPNGSDLDAAGLCDATGRILGLMPHPERFVDRTQHPCWTRLDKHKAADGLRLFQNAVNSLR
jgi:phosphoribosylformylglycinamidine synthase